MYSILERLPKWLRLWKCSPAEMMNRTQTAWYVLGILWIFERYSRLLGVALGNHSPYSANTESLFALATSQLLMFVVGMWCCRTHNFSFELKVSIALTITLAGNIILFIADPTMHQSTIALGIIFFAMAIVRIVQILNLYDWAKRMIVAHGCDPSSLKDVRELDSKMDCILKSIHRSSEEEA